jgi:hypothetical protein
MAKTISLEESVFTDVLFEIVTEVSNEIIKQFNMIEIYKITCLVNNKLYIGQTVSFLSTGMKKGYKIRFKQHISNAIKKRECCPLLEKSIRKFGFENFRLELLFKCDKTDANEMEIQQIKTHNTLVPNGYNLLPGGLRSEYTNDIKDKISTSKKRSHYNKRKDKYKNTQISKDIDSKSIIYPKYRNKIQIGWCIYTNDVHGNCVQMEFGSVKSSIPDSYKDTFDFIECLKIEKENNKGISGKHISNKTKRFDKYRDIQIAKDIVPESIIKSYSKNKIQIGWTIRFYNSNDKLIRIYFSNKKLEKYSINELYDNALSFIRWLQTNK